MSTLLRTTLLTCLTILPLQAYQLRVLAWNHSIAKRDLTINYGKKSLNIIGMHPFARSQVLKVPKNAQSLRVSTPDRLSPEGTPLFVPIEIPSGVKRPLLLILPEKDNPTGIKTLVIDDSVDNFEWGSMRFVNVTGEALVFRHEDKNQLIPNGWKTTSVTPKGKNRNMGVSIYLRKNLQLPPLYSSIWKHRQELRKLIFIIPSKDKSRGHVDFKFIVENRAVVKVEREQARDATQ